MDSTRTESRPSWPVHGFSMNEAEAREMDCVKTICCKASLIGKRKTNEGKQNTHTLNSQGYQSVIQEHDTEIRG